jgi:hypothetical protein
MGSGEDLDSVVVEDADGYYIVGCGWRGRGGIQSACFDIEDNHLVTSPVLMPSSAIQMSFELVSSPIMGESPSGMVVLGFKRDMRKVGRRLGRRRCLELLGEKDGIVESATADFGDGDADDFGGGVILGFLLGGDIQIDEASEFHGYGKDEKLYKGLCKDRVLEIV